MKLTVKKLGPIEEVTIDLSKDLIVLTGQNNTGKTYLTNLICGLPSLSFPYSFSTGVLTKKSDSSVEINLQEELSHIIPSMLENELPTIFASNHPSVLRGRISCQFEKSDVNKIKSSFIDAKTFGRMTNKVWRIPNDKQNEYNIIPSLSDNNILSFKISFLGDSDSSNNSQFNEFFTSYFTASMDHFLFFFLPAIKYFSSERQGINLFHRDLGLFNNKTFNLFLNRKESDDLRTFLADRINRFPIGIRKNLEIIEEVESKKHMFNGDYASLVEELETTLLNAKVALNENGEIVQKVNKTNERLPIQLSSSSFKSLSLLVLYLRHSANKGDTIIIDEPELNLHPDSQRKVARFLGRLVNEGFKVIISTHSDYIIKELNNMIMLSSANGKQEDLLNRLGYNKNQLLKPKQVEAHLFTLANPKPEKIEVDKTGFSVTTIDEVIDSLDSDTEEIYYQLFEQENIA